MLMRLFYLGAAVGCVSLVLMLFPSHWMPVSEDAATVILALSATAFGLICTRCRFEDPDGNSECPVCGCPNGQKTIQMPTSAGTQRGGRSAVASIRTATVTARVRPETLVRTARMVYVMLVLDVSASMDGAKIKELYRSVLALLEQLRSVNSHCGVGIVKFCHRAQLLHKLQPPIELAAKIVPFKAGGGTDIAGALELGNDELSRISDGSVAAEEQLLCLLSDGNSHTDPTEAANVVKSAGRLLLSVRYGQDASEEVLKQVASSPELYFAKPATGGELKQFFRQLGTATRNSVTYGQSLRRSITQI